MATQDRKANRSVRNAEAAELNDAVLSVLAHELGGIAGALDLRAEVLTSTIPPEDKVALRTLAEEVREATRTVRLIRSPDASGTLSPSREQTLAAWWRIASRITRVVLPRGTSIDASIGEAQLIARNSAALTWLWLSACKEIAQSGPGEAVAVELQVGPEGDGLIRILAKVSGSTVSEPSAKSRWARHAARIAAEAGANPPQWNRSGEVLQWSCDIPAR